jgi:superfamily I DNA/RNA helicase
MNTWLLPRSELTPEQLRVVEMSTAEHRVIAGPPGSGKTQVLVHRAAHIVDAHNVPPGRYRIFVFTNVIKEYIRSALKLLRLPEEAVSTFDHWCRLVYEAGISRRLPRAGGGGTINFDQIRTAVLRLFQESASLQKQLDFVLVDEGQDLSGEVYEILRLAARHITVFADPLQKIFEDGAPEVHILGALGIPRRNATLLAAYRNSPCVAGLASCFIDDPLQRRLYLAQRSTEQQVRELPLCFEASSIAAELDRLAEIIGRRLILNERIGIIVPTKRQVHGVSKGLDERGVAVQKAIHPDALSVDDQPLNFGSPVPKISTYHSAKGLTFDSVLMPRLVDRSFPWVHGAARHRMLFVGISRATQWAYVSTVKGDEFSEMELIRRAQAEGRITLQETCGLPPSMPLFGGYQPSGDELSVL